LTFSGKFVKIYVQTHNIYVICKIVFVYFRSKESTAVFIMTRTLASYEYIQDQNRYLEILEYGNGDKVQYTYDDYGRLLLETFEDGDPVVSYTYDAWGNILSTTGSLATTLGTWNPLRYRGYVYDPETGLYYLQSRYYNPTWGRFLNADVFISTGQGILGNNMFAYCGNNPVKNVDHLGYFGICVLDDPMNVNRAFMTPGMFGGGGGGAGGYVAGVSSSYYVSQNVKNYDRWWRNSCYNPNMSWSNGSVIQKSTNDDAFNSFVEDPHSLKGKTPSDMSEILGDTWIQGEYGSAKNGWKFIKGDKMIAYHPGGGRHGGSYYKLSSEPTRKIKFIGPDHVASPDDGAIIIQLG
jgi:RHS repeat-associated protein